MVREPEPCLFPPTRFFAVWLAERCRRPRAGLDFQWAADWRAQANGEAAS